MTAPAADRLQHLVSAIFVPAGDRKLIASASDKGFETVILDLEDAIPEARKGEARDGLARDVAQLRNACTTIMVRVNHRWRHLFYDLEAAVRADADVIMLPKVEVGSQVGTVAEILDEFGAEAEIALISQIESAKGVLAMPAIAATRPDRHAGLMLGPEDLALDLKAGATAEVMAHYAQSLITAARAAGLLAIGSPGSIAETRDLDAYRRQLEAGKEMGFDAVVAIHPRQLSIIEDVYRPSESDVAEAQGLLSEANKHGGKPFLWNGKMVDTPVVARARNLIKKASRRA